MYWLSTLHSASITKCEHKAIIMKLKYEHMNTTMRNMNQ